MSFGSATPSQLVGDAISEAIHTHDTVAVAAVGNFASAQTQYPAGYPDVIGVGGSDSGDRLWDRSQRAAVDLIAPAVNLIGARAGTSRGYMIECGTACSGTSYAAPHVSGAVALVRSLVPDASVADVTTWLYEGADQVCGPVYNHRLCGWGRLNLRRTLELASGQPTPTATVQATLAPTHTAAPTHVPDVALTLTALAPEATARPTPSETPVPQDTATARPSAPPTATIDAEGLIGTQVAATLTAAAPTWTPDVGATVTAALATLTAGAPTPNVATRVAATRTAMAPHEYRLWLPALLVIRPPDLTATPTLWYGHATMTARARPTLTPRPPVWPTP